VGQVDDNNNEDGEMRCWWVLSRGGTPRRFERYEL